MDDLQFIFDDDIFLNYTESFDIVEETPKFDINEIHSDIFDFSPQVPPPSDGNNQLPESKYSPDQSRFPVYTEQDIKELKGNASNKNRPIFVYDFKINSFTVQCVRFQNGYN